MMPFTAAPWRRLAPVLLAVMAISLNACAILTGGGDIAYRQKADYPGQEAPALWEASRRGLAEIGRVTAARPPEDWGRGILEGVIEPYLVRAETGQGEMDLMITGRTDGRPLAAWDPTARSGPGMQRDKVSRAGWNPDAGLTPEQRSMTGALARWQEATARNLGRP